MTALARRLEATLASRSDRQMLRALDPNPPPSSTLVDFCSNDYLSLSRSPNLRKKLLDELNKPSTPLFGPPSSRLLDGNSTLHASLEHRLASFFCAPSALLFNSGFDANSGLWSCLPAPDDWIVFDELVHASIHDGMRASRVPKERRRAFKHNDVKALERLLRQIVEQDEGVRSGAKSVWVGVETLYSMDGDLVPLKEVAEVVERVLVAGNGHLVVDEAHSTGLYGPNGRGLVCALGLANRVTVRVHTFGKAMAASGGAPASSSPTLTNTVTISLAAAVLASPLIRNYLINYARPLIYSTTMTHLSALAVHKSLELLEEGGSEEPAANVHSLASLLISRLSAVLPSTSSVSLPRELLALASYSSTSSHRLTSPIIPLLTQTPRPLSSFLRQKGFLVRPITYPTVPKGEERVRVCLHAGNAREEVEGLVRAVEEWVKREEREKEEGRVQDGRPSSHSAEALQAKL